MPAKTKAQKVRKVRRARAVEAPEAEGLETAIIPLHPEDGEEDALEGYESTIFESVGVLVDEFALRSREYARLAERARIKRALARTAPIDQKKGMEDEAKSLEEKSLPPIYQELQTIVVRAAEVMSGDKLICERLNVWSQLPRNLRPLLARQLKRTHRINVDGLVERAEAVQREQEAQAARS